MPYRQAFYRVWANFGKPGRCKGCRRRIVWETTDKGKMLPFDAGRPIVSVGEDAVTGAKFVMLNAGDLHFKTCTKPMHRPERKEQRSFL